MSIMIKPHFDELWLEFPDYAGYPSLKDLYTALGGAAEKDINMPGSGQMEILVQAV
jgi:hypothetical protein